MGWWTPDIVNGPTLEPKINGQIICELALCRLFGFSESKLKSAKERDANMIVIHGNVGNQNAAKTAMQENLHNWLSQFFEEFGDQMPNSEGIHMPSYCSKNRLYLSYKDDAEFKKLSKRNIASESTFRAYIKSNFPLVKFPRKTRLARCNFCTSINSKRLKCSTDEERNILQKEIDTHLEIVKNERLLYHQRRDKAARNPTKIASIIIDSPEKLKLPNIVPIPKQLARAKVLEVGIVGTICHNTGKRCLQLTMPDVKKGADSNISALFWEILSMLKHYKDQNLQQPAILFIQMDNGSENKNRWMFGFILMLIYWKWFLEVNIYFLQPGHTHEDVDQMFSTLSLWLDTNSVGSIPSLISNLPKAWNKSPSYRPQIKCFPAFMNWSQWLAPHLKDFSGHNRSYAFIFRLQSNGRPGMKMKTLAQSKLWQGTPDDPTQWIDLFTTIPTGYPSLSMPDLIALDSIADIDKFENWITTEEHTWLTSLKERRKLHPPIEIPQNWNQFHQYKLEINDNNVLISIQDLVGNGPEAFQITGESSIKHLPAGSVPLQSSNFRAGQFVAVRPNSSSSDDFWLAKIISLESSNNDVLYKLHYWIQKPGNTNVWKEMRGPGAYGDAFHSAVIFGPISLTSNNSIPVALLKHITENL